MDSIKKLNSELAEAQRKVDVLKKFAEDAPVCCKCGTRIYGYDEHNELKRQLEFWRAASERRGDEIKRMYTEASHKEEPK